MDNIRKSESKSSVKVIAAQSGRQMKRNKNILRKTIYIIGLTTLFAPGFAMAQQTGVHRTELLRHDLSTPGYEAVQISIDFEKGTAFGKHTHPGEEIIYVLEGVFKYEIEGKPPVILKAGEVLFIPAGKVHAAKNIGNTKATELATYIVQKGKPLVQTRK